MMQRSSDLIKDAIPNPTWIVSELDKTIIGQTAAKEAMALAVLIRGLCMLQGEHKINIETQFSKSNILLIGNTGTGKTSLIRALAEVTNIPIYIFDVAGVTANGWSGNKFKVGLTGYIDHVVDWVEKHYYWMDSTSPQEMFPIVENCLCNGIFYMDEIDKIANHDDGKHGHSTFEVQDELLKVLENGSVSVDYKRGKYSIESLPMQHITMIGGGAFSGIEDIITTRLKSNNGIGFTSNIQTEKKRDIIKNVTTADLCKYGFKKEFVGRFAIVKVLEALTPKIVESIIVESKTSPLLEYKAFFELFGINLVIRKDGLKVLCDYITTLDIGARGITLALRKILTPYMFNVYNLTDKTIEITKKMVEDAIK